LFGESAIGDALHLHAVRDEGFKPVQKPPRCIRSALPPTLERRALPCIGSPQPFRLPVSAQHRYFISESALAHSHLHLPGMVRGWGLGGPLAWKVASDSALMPGSHRDRWAPLLGDVARLQGGPARIVLG